MQYIPPPLSCISGKSRLFGDFFRVGTPLIFALLAILTIEYDKGDAGYHRYNRSKNIQPQRQRGNIRKRRSTRRNQRGDNDIQHSPTPPTRIVQPAHGNRQTRNHTRQTPNKNTHTSDPKSQIRRIGNRPSRRVKNKRQHYHEKKIEKRKIPILFTPCPPVKIGILPQAFQEPIHKIFFLRLPLLFSDFRDSPHTNIGILFLIANF